MIRGLWELTAPPPPTSEPLRGEQTADVVVIGAGYTGLSSALHLSESGASVAVVEAVDIGHGGSGRNVGLVNAGLWVMPDEVGGALGEPYAERLMSLLSAAPAQVFDLIAKHNIQCEVQRSGTLHCAVGESGLKNLEARTRQWQARRARVELLDREQAAAKIGTNAYAGALLDHRAGTIQPLAYARGLAEAAQHRGTRIYTQSPVEAAERSGQEWRVKTDSGSVTAAWVIVATDTYTCGPWPEIREQQVLLPYFNIATAPLPEALRQSILPERQGAWDTARVLSSFRLDQHDRLIFGSLGALCGGARTAVHREWSRRAIRKLFPQLENVELDGGWFGMIGMTADNMPRFHKLAPNVISFSAYNGRGIAPGTAFGKVLADHINGAVTEQQLPLPVTQPRRAPLRHLKEAAYDFGSQLVHFASVR